MYRKDEISIIKKEFWTAFGKYMQPIPSAGGLACNWVNYKTGVKNFYFRMDADQYHVVAAVELAHTDPGERLAIRQKIQLLLQDNSYFQNWKWREYNEGQKGMLRLADNIQGVNIMDREHWPLMITFLKSAVLAFDDFWALNKEFFESSG